jgi:hypothetical protein
MIDNWETLVGAAEQLFDEYEAQTAPLDPTGITGTSIGLGETCIGIIVHIQSSQSVADSLPDIYKNFQVYKRFESK